MSLTNHIVAKDELFLPFSLEEIDASDCFFFSQMFSSIPDLPSAFYPYNSSSSSHDPLFAISSSSSSFLNNNNNTNNNNNNNNNTNNNNNNMSMGSQLNTYLNH